MTSRLIASLRAVSLLSLAIMPVVPARAECRDVTMYVSGRSLQPLLKDGSLIEGRMGDCPDPASGDLAVFTHNGVASPLIKLVIGIPGDRFAVRADGGAWNILINGAVAENAEGVPYRLNKARANMIGLYVKGAHGVIPPNAWLLMGDDPAGTDDSSRFGLITRAALRGTAAAPKRPHSLNGGGVSALNTPPTPVRRMISLAR